MHMRVAAIVLAVGSSGVSSGMAQQLTLYAGETRYQVADGGQSTSWLGGVSVGRSVWSFLRTDISVVAFEYRGSSFAEGWSVAGTRLVTELGIYVQPWHGWLQPYFGWGAGLSVSHRRVNDEGARFGRVTEAVHAAFGSDVGMSRDWAMRMEVRLRGIIGPGPTSDLTLGLSHRRARKR
jgi:hypothetical protein